MLIWYHELEERLYRQEDGFEEIMQM